MGEFFQELVATTPALNTILAGSFFKAKQKKTVDFSCKVGMMSFIFIEIDLIVLDMMSSADESVSVFETRNNASLTAGVSPFALNC